MFNLKSIPDSPAKKVSTTKTISKSKLETNVKSKLSYDATFLLKYCICLFVRMRDSYKRFVKTWIRFANPWIRIVS